MNLKITMGINRKKGILCALFFCIVGFPSPAYAQTLQQQIDNLQAGEVLELIPGQYSENIIIDKAISINGNKNVALLGKIEIMSDDVEIKGIQFLGQRGIVARKVKNIKITESTFRTDKFPIYFDGVVNSKITKVDIAGESNHYSKMSHGISLYNSKDIYINHSIVTQVQDGIYLEGSMGVIIEGNKITHGRYGTHIMYGNDIKLIGNDYAHHITGIMAMMVDGVIIESNSIKQQNSLNSSGLTLYQSSNVNIIHNTIRENSIAVQFQQAESVNMSENIIASNLLVLKNMQPKDILFTKNKLYGNVLVASSGSEGIKLLANTYDDYGGEDFDGDGYGDSEYIATSTFGKWVLKNEHYQYFIGNTATELLNKMDKNIAEENTLVDMMPVSQERQAWQLSFSLNHFSIGISLLVLLIFSWRRLK